MGCVPTLWLHLSKGLATVSFGDKYYFVFSSPSWIHKEEIPVVSEEEAEEDETESQKEEGPDKVTSE